MNLLLGLQGDYDLLPEAYESFPDWDRAHLIGHHGQFGQDQAWSYESPDGMFNTRTGPDGWWNRGRWSRHEQAVAADVKAWAKIMRPKPGEPIVFNHEHTHWRAFHTYPDGGTKAKSVKRRNDYLAAVYQRTAKTAKRHLPGRTEALPTEIGPNSISFGTRFIPMKIGASGVFAQQWRHGDNGMLDPQWFHQNCTHSTLGLDFFSPQLYVDEEDSESLAHRKVVQSITAAPQLRCIPIISPFYERTFTMLEPWYLAWLRDLLGVFTIDTAIVWCNFAVRNGHELEARIEQHRPALERLREVFG